MPNKARQIILEYGDDSIAIQGDPSIKSDFYITDEGIEGWFSNPTAKVSSSERTTGDGSHRVVDYFVQFQNGLFLGLCYRERQN